MKAIQTLYKGRKFRSRLEARWACFFDALGVAWDYEPEGFEFHDGSRYLPDFYIPEWRTYVEIKPRLDDAKSPEMEKARQVCWSLMTNTNLSVLLIIGNPWLNEYIVEPMGWVELLHATFGQCRKCDSVYLVDVATGSAVGLGSKSCPKELDKYPLSDEDASDIVKALRAASSARFEHGESGAPR